MRQPVGSWLERQQINLGTKLYHGPVPTFEAFVIQSPTTCSTLVVYRADPTITGEYAFGPRMTVSGPIVGGNLVFQPVVGTYLVTTKVVSWF